MVALVALLSSGCLILDSDDTSASRDEACLAVCDCLFFSPSAAQGCADECVADPESLPATDICLECLTTLTCNEIETGGCNDECAATPEPS